jgi:tetratricopeptide (TPR) repeat protein
VERGGNSDRSAVDRGFVGRERERGELRAALDDADNGRGCLFLISGEPGIGKTRLADELAAEAGSRGMRVAWGRCWEGGGAPAYWPWVEIVRSVVFEPGRARLSQTAIPPEIGQLIPELSPETIQQSISSDPKQARFRLFDAAATLLKQVARAGPLVLILDDLHEADRSSLELLKFVARGLTDSRIVVVCTHRDAEVRRSPYLAESISEILRHGNPMPLFGLDENEVTQMIEYRAERLPSATFASELHRVTAGNPLFVDGVIRVLVAERKLGTAEHLDLSSFKLPEGVRGAIRKRLAMLSAEAQSALAVAAVIGQEFDAVLLQRVLELSAEPLSELIREASEVGIVTAASRESYRFTHPLIREALYNETADAERVRLHRATGEALEHKHAANLTPQLAALAHHFREAGLAEKAIDYSVRAGQSAASVLAFTEAIVHWQAALELMEEQGSDARRRAELLESLGRVAFEIDQVKSVQYRESAIALYESIGCLEEAALIHMRLGTSFSMQGQPLTNNALAAEHLRRAESVLAKGPETISLGWLYQGIARTECLSMNLAQAASAARHAMEIADRLGDKVLWANAAAAYAMCLVVNGRLEEGFVLLGRALEAADQANSTGAGLVVAWTAGGFSNLLGDPRGARGWYERELNMPRNAHAPFRRQILSFLADGTYLDEGQFGEARRRLGSENLGIRFWVAGEWEEVAALEEAAAEVSTRAGDVQERFNWSTALGPFYLFLGEYTRAEAHLQYGLDNGDRGPVLMQEMRARPWLALVYVAMNRLDAAAEQVARCNQIMAYGEDWRGRAADVARADAVVAAANGSYEVANRQFESALAVQHSYRLAMEEVTTLRYWGSALAAAGDRASAAEKFDAAIEIYRARGVSTRLVEYLTAYKMRDLGPKATGANAGGAEHPERPKSRVAGAFRKEGEFWTIIYDHATIRLRDAKGLRYIAYLLARPGERIHVHDLVTAVEGCSADAQSRDSARSEGLEVVQDNGGPAIALDSRARSEYAARLREVRAELEEANRFNDAGRSERLRAEIEVLSDELNAGFGRRGASDSAERARGMVSKRIRATLDKICDEDPALGRHFTTSIKTGYFCAYLPDPDHKITWQL